MVATLGVTLALVPLWCVAVSVHARRAGAPETRRRSCIALFGVAAGLNVVSMVFDGDVRSTISLLCLVGCLIAALLAVTWVVPILRWFERGIGSLVVWTISLPFIVLVSWIAQPQRPIDPQDALEVLSFFAALEAIIAGIALVVAALSTADIEDEIRLTPELAVPAD